jgi:hypothetical protein
MSIAPFTGAWKLITSEMRSSTGGVLYPLGEECVGRLIVDSDGNFTAQLMRPDRPQFASGDVVRGTDEEIRAAYQGFVAFWAKIEVDQAAQEITYVVEGSLFPNWVGHRNLRHYQFDGNRLTLKTPPFLMAEQELVGVLVWERIS